MTVLLLSDIDKNKTQWFFDGTAIVTRGKKNFHLTSDQLDQLFNHKKVVL